MGKVKILAFLSIILASYYYYILLALVVFTAGYTGQVPTSTPVPAPTPVLAPPPRLEAREAKGVYITGTSAGDAETLNWILAADSASFGYAGHTVDSLVTYDNEYRIQLRCAAKDIETSEDGLVYTVTIRDDLKWSDGSTVTAEDYVYTLNNLMFSDWLNYPYKSDWQEEVDGKTMFVTPKAVSDTTFTIARQTVDPEFIYNVRTLVPYPKYISVKYEGDIKTFTEAPELNNLSYTGNLGPYKFVEWVRNDKFVLERNPEYYLGKDTGAPYFEKYIEKLFGTPATVHGALEAKDITSTGIDPSHVAKFKKMDWINIYTVPTTGYLLMAYNLRDNGWEGLKQKEVRQALSMAVSKELLIQQVLYGFGEPAFSFIPRISPWYEDKGLAKYGVEPLLDKGNTKELLLEAGYAIKKADDSIEVRDNEGKPLKLTLVTNAGNEVHENVGHLVKQELAAIGIEVELKFVPWATELRKYVMNKVPGTDQEPRYNNGVGAVSEEPWDLLIIIFGTHPLSPSGSNVFYTTNGGLNFWGSFNPRIDELFKRLKSKEALDEKMRKQLYAELSQLISEEQPVNFLAFQLANHGFQRNVKGIEPGIRMGYNYHLWYFE
ncbi:ABC transporter substrate-binding protein [Chloroflexota bacterium]